MLKKQTVFVLGAGASHPYGFPLGAGLSARICENAIFDQLEPWTSSGEISKSDIEAFVSAFKQSGMLSIDSFLERRDEYLSLGRLAIAAILCRQEVPLVPFEHNRPDNWYKALWREMTYGANDPSNALRNVAFITFNYDRSLEYFLSTAIRNSFKGIAEATALAHLKRIHILHVYGSLGDFHWADSLPTGQRAYRHEPPAQSIGAAATRLRLIPDGREDSVEFQSARKLFEHAEVICFLGFGFDETNVERLGLARVLRYNHERQRPPPRIIISALKKTPAQVKAIKEALTSGVPYLVDDYDKANLDTLALAGLIG